MRSSPATLAAALILVLAGPAHATLVVAQQGYLLAADDTPISNPAVSMAFRILEAQTGESVAWQSGACAVSVAAGYYGVLLGAGATGGCGSAIPEVALPPGVERWLEVTVSGVVLSPRQRLNDVPTAAEARHAGTADVATTSLDTTQLRSDLASAVGGVNAGGLVHWHQLIGVPGGLADGLDDDHTYAADGSTLALSGGTFSVKPSGVAAAQLASDPLSLGKVSGGVLSVTGTEVASSGALRAAGPVRMGNATTCDSNAAGSLRFDGADFWGCNGTTWSRLGAVASGGGSGGTGGVTISSVSPSSGTGDGSVPITITGTNFAAPAAVSIGGVPATNVQVVNATTITALAPVSTTVGARDVLVTTGGNLAVLVGGFSILDPSVVLLLHFDAPAGSQVFTDSSSKARAVTAVGNAQHSAVSKFGSGSLLLDGNGDYLTMASSADFALASNEPVTVEFWYRHLGNSPQDNRRFFSTASTSNRYTAYVPSSSASAYGHLSGGVTVNGPAVVTDGAWHHVAWVRTASGQFGIAVDGVFGTFSSDSSSMPTDGFWIGSNSCCNQYLHGYLDEFRLTKGVARYTTTFTPPAAPFGG